MKAGSPRRLLALVAIALALAIFAVYRLFVAPQHGGGTALAYTECPFEGPARVVMLPGIAPEDTLPVRMHEDQHVAQCQSLGPWRYRWRNLTGRGRLTLEAPAYCAGARARLQQGQRLADVRERLLDDAEAAFQGLVTPREVAEALSASCTEIAGQAP